MPLKTPAESQASPPSLMPAGSDSLTMAPPDEVITGQGPVPLDTVHSKGK